MIEVNLMPICRQCGQYYVRPPCPSCGTMPDEPVTAAPVSMEETSSIPTRHVPVVKEEKEEHVVKPSEVIPEKEATAPIPEPRSAPTKGTVEASLESLKGYVAKTKEAVTSEEKPSQPGIDVPYRKLVMEKLLEIRNLIDEILEL